MSRIFTVKNITAVIRPEYMILDVHRIHRKMTLIQLSETAFLSKPITPRVNDKLKCITLVEIPDN